MSAERSIEMAEKALQADKPVSASALYESAARELANDDRRRAAHLFLLASSHAAPGREDSLAEEAQRLYGITCAKHAAMRLAQILVVDHGPDLPGSMTPTMEVLFDQIAHSRAKLSELEDLR